MEDKEKEFEEDIWEEYIREYIEEAEKRRRKEEEVGQELIKFFKANAGKECLVYVDGGLAELFEETLEIEGAKKQGNYYVWKIDFPSEERLEGFVDVVVFLGHEVGTPELGEKNESAIEFLVVYDNGKEKETLLSVRWEVKN